MKKILSLLASLALTGSATSVVSCNIFKIEGNEECFDQSGNNVTTKWSEKYQWKIFTYLELFMAELSSEDFPDSASFQKLDHVEMSMKISKDEEPISYTLLLRTYKSVDEEVVEKMKNELHQEENGIYLFLNLPDMDLDNIKNATDINFQFLILTKKSRWEIINNKHNDWVFWEDCQTTNDPVEDGKNFFNFQDSTTQRRVITSIEPQ